MIQAVGIESLAFLKAVQGFFILFFETTSRFFLQLFQFKLRYRLMMREIYSLAVESLPIVVFALSFVGLMLMIEFSYHMKLVLRQDSLVPAFSTVLMLRELGPVVTSLLLASRIGAGISAEIGSMKITEQIDALKLLSIDPIEYLAIPRWIGGEIACIGLSLIASSFALVCSAMIASIQLGLSPHEFFNTMFTFTRFFDLSSCVIKAAVFGAIIPIIAVFHGLNCEKGSDGVGNAATKTVVHSSMLIIITDFILTYLLYAL